MGARLSASWHTADYWRSATAADVQERLDAGFIVSERDSGGETVLHHAGRNLRSVPVLETLMNGIPRIDRLSGLSHHVLKDNCGHAPIHEFARYAPGSTITRYVDMAVASGESLDTLRDITVNGAFSHQSAWNIRDDEHISWHSEDPTLADGTRLSVALLPTEPHFDSFSSGTLPAQSDDAPRDINGMQNFTFTIDPATEERVNDYFFLKIGGQVIGNMRKADALNPDFRVNLSGIPTIAQGGNVAIVLQGQSYESQIFSATYRVYAARASTE